MTKQHHQGTRAATSPGSGLATQPGDPGAVPPKLANTSGAAPGITSGGWNGFSVRIRPMPDGHVLACAEQYARETHKILEPSFRARAEDEHGNVFYLFDGKNGRTFVEVIE